MNPYLVFVLVALLGRYLLELAADILNVRHAKEDLPAEFAGLYDAERYRTAQRYLRERTALDTVQDTVETAALIAFLLAGGFNRADGVARAIAGGPILCGVAFVGLLLLGFKLLGLPFSVYDTFVIEQRYGFNRTTPRTFVLDLLKVCALAVAIGGPVFAGVTWFFERAGAIAWLYAWLAVSAVQTLLAFLAPYVILPLFNTYVPLADGPLKAAIEEYASRQSFRIRGVFTMDGSRRSTKANAFFTGFGRSRRIVLYDTLIARHSPAELVAVVAHELGHYRKRHVLHALARSTARLGISFALLSLFIRNERLFAAFGMEHVSVYASLVFFGFLYTPLLLLFSVLENTISRRHEYAADAFAVRTTGNTDAMASALQTLSVEHLANLTPHPLHVALNYSHPPVLDRVRAMRSLAAGSPAP